MTIECHRNFRGSGTGEAGVKIEISFHLARISDHTPDVAPGASSNNCFGIATDSNSEQQAVPASVWAGDARLSKCCTPSSQFPYSNIT
jgi:hypothetical protein